MEPSVHQKCTIKELYAMLDEFELRWQNLVGGEYAIDGTTNALFMAAIANCGQAMQKAKRLLNREFTRVLVGVQHAEDNGVSGVSQYKDNGVLDVSQYVGRGPVVPLNNALSALARGGIDISLSARAREEMEAMLPALATFASWGSALIDKADPARTSVSAVSSFLLNQTTYNADGGYTKLCRDAEREAAQARRR